MTARWALQWFLGPARTVSGHIATLRHGSYLEVEDTAVLPYHHKQVEDFLVSLAEGRAPEVDAVEARKALELVLAIYESSRTGESVRLPQRR
ncbi:MAG: hypothetical protein ACRDN9_00305 [Streptosporangiaceae bacterium]